MKKRVKYAILLILIAVIGVAITWTIMQAKASKVSKSEKNLYYSFVSKEAVNSSTEGENHLVTVPWLVFTVGSETNTGSVLTLEMIDETGKNVYLYVKEINGLIALCSSKHRHSGSHITSMNDSELGEKLISSAQMIFHSEISYTAVAVDSGLYIYWDNGNVFLPYNNMYIYEGNIGYTYNNDEYVHLICKNILDNWRTADGKVDYDKQVEVVASSSDGDVLYAGKDAFTNIILTEEGKKDVSEEFSESVGKERQKKVKRIVRKLASGIWRFFGIIFILIIIMIMLKKKRVKKSDETECKNKISKQDEIVDLQPSISHSEEIVEIEEKIDKVNEDIDSLAYINNNEIQDDISIHDIYTKKEKFYLKRSLIKEYNLDIDQISEYRKSSNTDELKVRLVKSDSGNSCFVLMKDDSLWIHPIRMNQWNAQKLKLDMSWFKNSFIQYAFVIMHNGERKLISFISTNDVEVLKIVPANVEKMGNEVFVSKKGIIYI